MSVNGGRRGFPHRRRWGAVGWGAFILELAPDGRRQEITEFPVSYGNMLHQLLHCCAETATLPLCNLGTVRYGTRTGTYLGRYLFIHKYGTYRKRHVTFITTYGE